MAKKKPRTLPLGADGALELPPDVLAALGIEAEDTEVEIYVDTRRKQLRVERHVDDPWAEALKEKEQKGFDDLHAEQAERDAEAKRIFEEKLKEGPGKRRPEDSPDRWR